MPVQEERLAVIRPDLEHGKGEGSGEQERYR
jgi:hypothetical protein